MGRSALSRLRAIPPHTRTHSGAASGFAFESSFMLRTALAVALLVPLSAPAVRAADPALDSKNVEFFESKIRPVLVEQCYKCHSEDAAKQNKLKGGLKLDTRDGLLK